MSRLLIASSLLAMFSSFAQAEIAPVPRPHFAQPPQAQALRTEAYVDPTDRDEPAVLDRATLRAVLVQQRAANLARFRAYQKRGIFPSNTGDRKLNVWRDDDGHICAAATIIKASGQDALVDRVAEQDNYIRLADVQQGPLMDWILTSGFTQVEIAAIQEPFMPVARPRREEPRIVDQALRTAEDARLRKRYREVDAMLVKNEKQSIELAIDRLMKHQQLAWQLVVR